jgi:hypothetical protein
VSWRIERLLAGVALLVGLAAWVYYLNEGLVLAHYDAKAHLVVARRVIDSLTPGWRQIGAVWLPLPHLIQILPTQIDVLYRTGAFGSLLSVACFAVAAWAMARLVVSITGSQLGAIVAAALVVLNPNLLYVHVTPMTEPLLLAATLVSVLKLYEWLTSSSTDRVPATLGWVLFLTTWTRYEAWLILGAAIALAAVVLWRRGHPLGFIVRQTWRLAQWPASAVVIFLFVSRLTVGQWFVSGGFYERDPTYDALAIKSVLAIWWGTHVLSGYLIEIVGLATAALIVWRSVRHRDEAAGLVTVALFAAAALPAYAFYEAHPFRIRYMVPVVTACALFCGIAVGALRPGRSDQPPHFELRRSAGTVRRGEPSSSAAFVGSPSDPTLAKAERTGPTAMVLLLAGLLVASTVFESPLWSQRAPLIVEAQLDAANSVARQRVTACLAPAYHGEKVLASMGSLAHYMQELSHDGFAIADFVHEGNGALWDLALDTGPAPHAGWMLVEEQSEGGDVLAQRVRRHDGFTRGMTKVCEGGGVSLYKRD